MTKIPKTPSLLVDCGELITELQVLYNKVDTCNYYYDRALGEDPKRAKEMVHEHRHMIGKIAGIMNKLDTLIAKEGDRYIN